MSVFSVRGIQTICYGDKTNHKTDNFHLHDHLVVNSPSKKASQPVYTLFSVDV